MQMATDLEEAATPARPPQAPQEAQQPLPGPATGSKLKPASKSLREGGLATPQQRRPTSGYDIWLCSCCWCNASAGLHSAIHGFLWPWRSQSSSRRYPQAHDSFPGSCLCNLSFQMTPGILWQGAWEEEPGRPSRASCCFLHLW